MEALVNYAEDLNTSLPGLEAVKEGTIRQSLHLSEEMICSHLQEANVSVILNKLIELAGDSA